MTPLSYLHFSNQAFDQHRYRRGHGPEDHASSGYLAVSTSIRVLNTDQDTAGRGHHQKEVKDPWKTHKTNNGLVLSVCFLTDIIHYF